MCLDETSAKVQIIAGIIDSVRCTPNLDLIINKSFMVIA
jgi:hypothetical protein